MSQNLINAIDLPSGTLPTTPVVIKDNDLAGMFNTSDYKYSQYGIPELTYIYINGDNDNITSTEVIQFVENGYYPIIKVTSNSSSGGGASIASTGNLLKGNGTYYPSDELYPGIWGFSYYFYENDTPYAMFTCLQEFPEEQARISSLKITTTSPSLREVSGKNDYLGTFTGYLVDDDGSWLTTTDLFYGNTLGGGVIIEK